MIRKLKSIALASITASITLLGGGPASALDVLEFLPDPGESTFGVFRETFNETRGCAGGELWVTSVSGNDFGRPGQQVAQIFVYFEGSDEQYTAVAEAWFDIGSNDSLTFNEAFAFSSGVGVAFPSNGGPIGQETCQNLTNIVPVTVTNTISSEDVFEAAGFLGYVFDATDTADGLRYRYFVGFEGVTNSQPVFRREILSPNLEPDPDTIVEETERAIASFILDRAARLATEQPRLIRFLRGEGCGLNRVQGNVDAGSLQGCIYEGNLWSEISTSWGRGTSYTLGTIGAHQFINENFLLGGMVQFDRMRNDDNNAHGTGWMAGPYFAAKMAEQPLYFEGRLLYGQTSNRISPFGTYTDSFNTERWLAQLRAEGSIEQETITWIPLFDFTHTRDRSKAYIDSLGNAISSQSVALTQLTSGLDFRAPLPSNSGNLELTGGASGIYAATDGGSADFENWRGRVHLGIDWSSGVGASIRASTFYDGIGSSHRNVGGKLGVDIRF